MAHALSTIILILNKVQSQGNWLEIRGINMIKVKNVKIPIFKE